jgi:hypothetical protein
MTAQNKLLVEGKDDLYVVCSLLEHYDVPDVFKVKSKDGVENLLETLDVELEESGLVCMGILVDADQDLAARWQSLRDKLLRFGYADVPRNPDPLGTVIAQDDLPMVGVWIMPDNRLPGMLEDFVGLLVPDGDHPLWERAGRAVDDIPPEEKKFPPERRSKAHIHTWLAWQEEPGKPMGLAITARYLDPNVVEARAFIAWLRRLFEIE